MFLHDAKAEPVFPVEAGKRPVMHTTTCLAFCVLHYVDGQAKVILCDSPTDQHLEEYFSGKLECSSKSLSLTDTNGFAFASVPLLDTFARVSLRMSEESNPDIVECVIENMATF